MRDSNHSFPNLNRACVSISSSLYDRRAIDSPVATLPLLTSLQHLAYLTSTSPRIREILTVDGGLERLISIVGICLDIAYPERARKPIANTNSNATASSSSAITIAQATSRTTASTDRKGKSAQKQHDKSQLQNSELDTTLHPSPSSHATKHTALVKSLSYAQSHAQKRIVPFKSFSAYANYPFSFDSDSEEGDDQEEQSKMANHMHGSQESTTMGFDRQSVMAAQKAALKAHQRQMNLLQAERQFYSDFISDYKDLPALVHTYGFALQCLVNVGVRGSESIRTRTVEAGVLGVVARILGGFLDYRSEERDRRAKILALAQSSNQSHPHSHSQSGQQGHSQEEHEARNRNGQHHANGDLTVISATASSHSHRHARATITSTTTPSQDNTISNSALSNERERDRTIRQRERSERHHNHHHHHHHRAHSGDSDSTQTVTTSRSRLSHRERQAAREAERDSTSNTSSTTTTPHSGVQVRVISATPLVAGMPASTVTPRISSSRQHQYQQHQQPLATPLATAAAVANFDLSSSGVPSAIPSPTTPISSSRRSASGALAPAPAALSLSSTSSSIMPSSILPIAIPPSSSVASSLMAASIINRTNTPDTIASIDEIQEFSDVNPDEHENESTSSGQENDDGMDVISETEQSSNSTLSKPSSRSVSRNRINATTAVLASLTSSSTTGRSNSLLSLPVNANETAITRDDIVVAASVPAVVQPGSASTLGDITIKLGRRLSPDHEEQDDVDDGEVGDDIVIDERDVIEEDGTDTGVSVSPISRPVSSLQYEHRHRHHLEEQQQQRSQLLEELPLPNHNLHHHNRQDSSMNVDNELTPVSRPQTLRRLSSNDVVTSTASISSTSASASASAHPSAFVSAILSTSELSLPPNAMSLAPPPVPVARSRSVDDHVTSRHNAANAVDSSQSAYNSNNNTTFSTTPSEFLGHAAAVTSQLQSFLQSRSQSERRSGLAASNALRQQQEDAPASATPSSTSTSSSSLHVHLRLHPQLQAQRTHGSVSASGAALIAYGPLMDHYMKEEDVLHCLHLLAYLSKYPHVRAVFHDPENEICKSPSATDNQGDGAHADGNLNGNSSSNNKSTGCCSCARKKLRSGQNGESSPAPMDDQSTSSSAAAAGGPAASASSANSDASACRGRCHSHAEDDNMNANGNGHCRSTSSGSQKHGHPSCCDDDDNDIDEEAESLARARAMATIPAKDRKPALEPSRPPRSTANNVFSLVEQYTFRPSSPADRSMRLGTDIQYWAGVIMRNACRKDELRGGIRQCANMGCGVWERFPREFAKCRRCRKAKYCSKGCQRRAWQAGHRYWCSARQDAPPAQGEGGAAVTHPQTGENVNTQLGGELADEAEELTDNNNNNNPNRIMVGGGNPNGGGGTLLPIGVNNNNNPTHHLRTGIVDGITVGGEDGNVDRADFEQRIRVGDAAGDMAMLDGM